MPAQLQNLLGNLSELLINTPFRPISSFYSKLIKNVIIKKNKLYG